MYRINYDMNAQASPPRPDRPAPPEDLVDFHLRWHAFRPHAIAILSGGALTRDQADLLGWLIALADRIDKTDVV